MTENQIEKLIWKELSKRGVTLYDMIGGDYIDPEPDDKTTFAGVKGDGVEIRRFSLSGTRIDRQSVFDLLWPPA
jgi:hypothetical protein